jgi:outer membrane protein insertion porin family
VLDIRIEGNRKHTREQVLNNMATRIGSPFDQAAFEQDVRKLTSRNWFVHVVPKKEFVPGGVVVTLSVVERPVIEYVQFFGNEKVSTRKLKKEVGLAKGDSFDPYAVREAARKIETLYQTKGYNDVSVDVPQGTKPGDRGAVFLIHEGKVQKFSDITFKGNNPQIAPDGRLKKIIESKEPFLFLFKGQVDPHKVESDVDKLYDFYRSLGFFQAKIGRFPKLNEDEDRVELIFYISEGPRYNVRNISFIGNSVYPAEALAANVKLVSGEPFNQATMNADIGTIKDLYGANGYVFADAVADLRFLEEPGELDIIYRVKEDQQYRIGDISITISGDNPHTRHSTIRNRLSMRPGDIADIRQFRSSERRIKASALFNVDPSKGELPRIVFSPPGGEDEVGANKNRASAKRTGNPDTYRGQSPDGPPAAPRSHTWPARTTTPAVPAPAAPPQTDTSGFLREQPPRAATVRAQSPDGYGGYGGTAVNPISPEPQPYAARPPQSRYATPAQYAEPAQDPLANPSIPGSGGTVPQDFGTDPGFAPPGSFPGGESIPPGQPSLPVEVYASEAQTGRFMLGAGINSNAGLVGSIILDEQNFDWRRWPTSWEDFRSGRAFRGAGQKFRIEAAPGTEVQRYLFNFAEPYLFDTPVSFGLSGYYFNRYYTDWIEQRAGGRVNLGYQFTPDLSGSIGLRAEDVLLLLPNGTTGFDDMGVLKYTAGGGDVPLDLANALGHTALYSAQASLAHDTRDSTFLPTEGHYITATFAYFMGTFQYPWFALNAQQHWLLRQRPDGTGRHTFSYYNQLGFSGPDTPLYERFYAGGFSTLRGFLFRGASPQQSAPGSSPILVGGDFQFLNTLEYMLPVTADDMLKMVAFVDFGTVESDVRIDWDQFRIAPGLGLRVTIPMISPAPIAIDFAVPVKHAPGDLLQNVSFFVGVGR